MNSQLHILLVDDNPEDRALVIREFCDAIFPLPNQPGDRREAVGPHPRSGNIDLVITDYQLRWSDGLACSGPSKPAGPNARLSCSPHRQRGGGGRVHESRSGRLLCSRPPVITRACRAVRRASREKRSCGR